MFGVPAGFFWAKQIDHSWDPDPIARARNERFEHNLSLLIPGSEPPQGKDWHALQTLLGFAARAGIIATLLGGLSWFLAFTTNSKLDAINTKQDTLQAMVLTHTVVTSGMADRLTRTDLMLERMVALMFAACMNGAKTESQRVACAQAAGK